MAGRGLKPPRAGVIGVGRGAEVVGLAGKTRAGHASPVAAARSVSHFKTGDMESTGNWDRVNKGHQAMCLHNFRLLPGLSASNKPWFYCNPQLTLPSLHENESGKMKQTSLG